MVVRKVMEIDDLTVKFITYHLNTGNSCGSASECTSRDFNRWVEREATPAEIVRLKYWDVEISSANGLQTLI